MTDWAAALTGEPALPLAPLRVAPVFDALLAWPPVKALLPLPVLALLAYPVWWFFHRSWRELDEEATAARRALADTGSLDLRPAAVLCITAAVLTIQEYYGGRRFYDEIIRPWLQVQEYYGGLLPPLARWDDLYGHAWWVAARVAGYLVVPFTLWKLLFPRDSLLDMGFRLRGFFSHLWIYAVCLVAVGAAMALVARQDDFLSYYPFYKLASRSVLDLVLWELLYFAQFFALEAFFRGWMVGALRPSLGSSAIFVMMVPYCMIHFGKPYLEVHGAIVAGVFLGSLAMKTRSIHGGFLVHIAVALAMDLLALSKRGGLPQQIWPP